MFDFDWLNPKKSKIDEIVEDAVKDLKDSSYTYSLPVKDVNFGMDKVKAYAESDGSVRIDFNGTIITIPGASRHLFLDKIRTAVQMADVADPSNDQLNRALTK